MERPGSPFFWPLLFVVIVIAATPAAGQTPYQKPPAEIQDVLDVPPTPLLAASPAGESFLLIERERYPALADLARPMLRLAGLRIDPADNGPHAPGRVTGLAIQDIAGGEPRTVRLPADRRVGMPRWSPDGRRFAFVASDGERLSLWIGSAETAAVREVTGLALNGVLGPTVQWLPDGRTLLCQAIVADRGPAPEPPEVPAGPVVQESFGRLAPARTYQDLLQSPHDEALFDHYARSQLVLVDAETSAVRPLGPAGIYRGVEPSPDGSRLLVTRIERPYSYQLPFFRFPQRIEVWDIDGQVEFTLAELPLAEEVPIEGVPTGPRSPHWRPTEPATLVWVEALDGGDPRHEADHRDRVLTLAAPFAGEPSQLVRLEHRYAGLAWGEGGLALIAEYDRDRRWRRTFQLDAEDPEATPQLLWDLSIHDRYGDPGSPVRRTLPSGHEVLWQCGDAIFLAGRGAGPEGDRPFLDRFDLAGGRSERLFQCEAGSYEAVAAFLGSEPLRLITRHESSHEPPNYRLHTSDEVTPLTDWPDPAPELRRIRKELVTYEREDGVPLSFTLYLPPDYQEGERLPAVLWAYPREFTDADTAGQVATSPHRFTHLAGTSHLFFLLAGYAVLDGATMPVVGDPETANDTFVDQVVASARAAIEQAAAMGVIDPDRVGVGGHSYGAFMTANLLAHSDLFRAGIARSGAYNRTLTPFGFQAERRTLWEAADAYFALSPFMHADRIAAPLLLIHGAEDNNAGTYPMQSERLYQAVRGHGGTVRFVSLPHESHGYRARESVEHTLFEMLAWSDQHVKYAPPRDVEPVLAVGGEDSADH